MRPDPRVSTVDGVRFRDLTGTGRMVPYTDPRRPAEERTEDLLARMTLAEKAGLMFHTMMRAEPEGLYEPGPDCDDVPHDVLSTGRLVTEAHIRHFNAAPRIAPADYARWHNRLQDLAAESRLGIPVTLSSDPVHGFVDNPATSLATTTFSRWPEPLGLAAAGDPELVAEFADVVRREYLAVGIRMALGPQADLATEPRWSRGVGTFGADADLAATFVARYVRAMQGERLGPHSVACMTKHYPGAGPQLRGEDAHFPYGREQVYPGGNAEYHLRPFRAAFEAGTAAVMPYYAIPVGLGVPEVGFGFNREVITGRLRERDGFDGVVCSDWGLVTDVRVGGTRWPARCWGAEDLSRIERVHRIIDAGVDQLGGEFCPELVVELVEAGRLPEARIDDSVRRVLRQKFRLGLFDDPYVDPDEAERIVGNPAFSAAGAAAQRRAITVLDNGSTPVLPLREGCRLHVDGVDPAVAAEYATVVPGPEGAEVAVVRIAAPYERRDSGIDYESAFHQGRLDFPPDEVARLVARLRAVPTVLVVHLDRPAVLPELVAAAAATVGEFGATDAAVLDVLFGRSTPDGRLPAELPSSTAAVEASREDVPNDSADPLFPAGHGLRLPVHR
ncbi:glycoside hydrolase family 3 N-terminal domain-containing protein [Amycolatopsis mongoliensis]|uniref:beta-glucosidase n=1 Tax=Amycolatopsis mongoliensis TaxID=715475 RepID=A0A9Y2JJC2_9PSEU|nr:glycoside hydrolase family 3 N-terminal domain-containing protein [Amycolatopsis sp. 4-36]WIX98535.1 glycoside hydrolase family 3 N-terminal domain-containing protein [Amycolatopsis sp. 4-36]